MEQYRIESHHLSRGWVALSHVKPYGSLDKADARLNRMLPADRAHRIVKYDTAVPAEVETVKTVEAGSEG